MTWDYIVIGAGSSGCAAAHELVRANKRVLVLEAGGSDSSPLIKLPAGTWFLTGKSGGDFDWGYQSQPDPSRDGANEAWHRGRVLGGTSSINGMVYVRGAPEDFQQWAVACDHQAGWSEAEISRVYREFESSDQTTSQRGQSGPLSIRTIKHPHRITRAFVEATKAAGYPFNDDYNGESQEGVSYLQFTQRGWFRCSAADAFLKPLRSNSNLRLLLNACVQRIEIKDGRAVAVIYERKGKLYREQARDIIVSAGVINTPKLLMLSGIGDPEELRRHKIDLKCPLPAVGRHLREHAMLPVSYRSQIPTNNLTEGLIQKLSIAAQYIFFQSGPIATAYEAAAFLKKTPSDLAPEFQIFFAPIGWSKGANGYSLAPFPAFNLVILRSHTASSGRIRLVSADPLAPPSIESQLLTAAEDIDTLAQGLDMVRDIMSMSPIASFIREELEPGSEVSTSTAVRDYIRAHVRTACHPIGTCRMGLGVDTVVAPDFGVHGVKHLWVADASVIPMAISANFNAVCMMLGAKLGRQLAQRRHHG